LVFQPIIGGPGRERILSLLGWRTVAYEENGMDIRPLADRADVIPIVAEWLHTELNPEQRTRAAIERQLVENKARRDSLPITFVALIGSDVVGTVSLDESDLPPYDHLSPWLASLYVVPPHRGSGIGRALVVHATGFARSKCALPIYLWTQKAAGFYEQCGWRRMHSDVYLGLPITVMKFE